METFSGPELIKTESAGLRKEDIKVVDIDLSKNKFNFDCQGEIQDILKNAQAKQAHQPKGADFVLDELGSITGLQLGQVEKLLQQATEFSKKREWKKALEIVEQALKLEPFHHEGLYLKAYCLTELKQERQALEVLSPIRQAKLESKLKLRIDALKHRIEGEMVIMIILHSVFNPTNLSLLQDLVRLDPDSGLYHYLFSVALMQLGKTAEARTALRTGLAEATADRARLEQLQPYVEMRYLDLLLKPALKLTKQRKFHQAKNKLKELDPAYANHALTRIFDSYLTQLDGGFMDYLRKSSKPVERPAGKLEDVENLYFFLAEEEINQALQLVKQGKYLEAETLLWRVYGLTPDFPYMDFMIGCCKYRRIATDVFRAPNFDSMKKDLEAALKHATIGAEDKKNPEAPELLLGIKDLMAFLDSVKKAAIARQEEVNQTNKAIEEFKQIMEMGKGGIAEIAQLNSIEERLKKLNQNLPAVRKIAQSKDTKEALRQLEDAVERNLNELKIIREQQQTRREENILLDRLEDQYKRIMEKGKGGVQSTNHRDEIANHLRSLKEEMRIGRMKMKLPESLKYLDQLNEIVDKNLNQLKNLNFDRPAVNLDERLMGLFGAYQFLVKQRQSGALKKNDFVDALKFLKDQVQNEIYSASYTDKPLLEQLMKVIDESLRKGS